MPAEEINNYGKGGGSDEEPPGPPAESEYLQRRSTTNVRGDIVFIFLTEEFVLFIN
ncbi:hypothetical protein A33I_02900 [Alkalihalophilus marmarensis DSM 21297]|uniref:Uncharacterized protein n=1 Tax=Alkalihalophilus marmarensis DSM 21297 TaxID=1188261 RepID=U6SIB0_9BACI|nr:hypothetical protein A33I_02900 [Alkalihalophilus marmarensis DSM 21297]